MMGRAQDGLGSIESVHLSGGEVALQELTRAPLAAEWQADVPKFVPMMTKR